MKLLLAFVTVTLTFVITPHASANETQAVVKVASGAPATSSFGLRGSGLLIRHQNAHYVLTSDHVVVHRKKCYQSPCHSFYWNEKWIEAELIRADWGRGLALLKSLESLPAQAGIDLPLKNTYVQEGAPVRASGFPAKSLQAYTAPGGRVLARASQRHYIPLLTQTLELIEAHGEFGMSGGPVFATSGALIGILSHQYLALRAGEPSVVGEFSNGSSPSNHLIVIPADVALQAVREWTLTSSAPAGFISERENGESVISDGVRFREVRSAGPVRMARGGGDGWGIGGKAGNDSPGIQVTLEAAGATDFPTQFPLQERQREFNQWREYVMARKPMRITGFVRRTENSLEKITIQSLSHFMTLLRDRSLYPIVVQGSPEASAEDSVRIKEIQVSKDNLRKVLQKTSALNELEIELITQINFIVSLIDEGAWPILRASDIEQITDPHGAMKMGWRSYYGRDFDTALVLTQELHRLRCAFHLRCAVEPRR